DGAINKAINDRAQPLLTPSLETMCNALLATTDDGVLLRVWGNTTSGLLSYPRMDTFASSNRGIVSCSLEPLRRQLDSLSIFPKRPTYPRFLPPHRSQHAGVDGMGGLA